MDLNKKNKFLEKRFKQLEKLIPKKRKKKIKKDLKKTNIHPKNYILISITATLSITLILSGILIPIKSTRAIGYGFIIFSILYYLMIKIPNKIKEKREYRLKKSLTRSLRTIATELKIGIPFSMTMEHASKAKTEAGKELRKVKRNVEKGMSYPEALSKMSGENQSKFVKRATKQLISAYSGDPEKSSEALKKLSNEQESKIKDKMEEYNQKLLFYSLIFIATSAIIPAMFQALIIVGSSFLELGITPIQAFIIPSIGFPVVNITMFIYIASKKP